MINGTIFPTKGWVERKGSIAFSRIMQGRSGLDRTPRQIANRIAMLYRTDPDEVVQFVGDFAKMKHLMDFRIAELPKNYQLGFNIALFYAIPFDFYLFDGSTFPKKGDLSERCREALEMRRQEATVIFATSDARAALQFGGTAALLYNGALTHYDSVKDAVAVYRRLPPPKRDTRFLPGRESPEGADEEDSWL
jgi:capsular polysaccharide transport system ATP-binding protein